MSWRSIERLAGAWDAGDGSIDDAACRRLEFFYKKTKIQNKTKRGETCERSEIGFSNFRTVQQRGMNSMQLGSYGRKQ